MSNRPFDVSRRTILRSSLLGSAWMVLPRAARAAGAESPAELKSMSAVGATTEGKGRGVVTNGVQVYRGVPYARSTAGVNRFMPPRKAEPWTGVRNAFQNGHSSPQVAPAPGAIGWGLRGSAA